jgi:addiction module HigA family antidote
MRNREPHPGSILRDEYILFTGLDYRAVAKNLHVSEDRLDSLINANINIDAEWALKLARCFGTPAYFWMNLQTRYDLCNARNALNDEIMQVQPLMT